MEKLSLLGAIFLSICLIGFYLAYLYGRKTKRFRWSEYMAILIWPVLFVVAFAYFFNVMIFILFLISSFVGFVLEYVVGLTYHKTLNRRLWNYGRLSIGGYTSLLSIPIWGVAGVIFWFLGKMVGL
jgi:uncharacterized membrane protein